MITLSKPYPGGLGRTLRLTVWAGWSTPTGLPRQASLASRDSLALWWLPWQQDLRGLTFWEGPPLLWGSAPTGCRVGAGEAVSGSLEKLSGGCPLGQGCVWHSGQQPPPHPRPGLWHELSWKPVLSGACLRDCQEQPQSLRVGEQTC